MVSLLHRATINSVIPYVTSSDLPWTSLQAFSRAISVHLTRSQLTKIVTPLLGSGSASYTILLDFLNGVQCTGVLLRNYSLTRAAESFTIVNVWQCNMAAK